MNTRQSSVHDHRRGAEPRERLRKELRGGDPWSGDELTPREIAALRHALQEASADAGRWPRPARLALAAALAAALLFLAILSVRDWRPSGPQQSTRAAARAGRSPAAAAAGSHRGAPAGGTGEAAPHGAASLAGPAATNAGMAAPGAADLGTARRPRRQERIAHARPGDGQRLPAPAITPQADPQPAGRSRPAAAGTELSAAATGLAGTAEAAAARTLTSGQDPGPWPGAEGRPGPSGSSETGVAEVESHTEPAQRPRQVQFSTPGGTRIIWLLNPAEPSL
ncbi:MAG TPA: hypothetical protein VHR45_22390 [Thermoanaerobaculia bacterium]|nr:hypothetical protein [Thermoanaerobaculia bacterium]